MEQRTRYHKLATIAKRVKNVSMKAKIVAFIGSASLLLLVGFWPSDLECGSEETKRLFDRIAKKNQPNKITEAIAMERGFAEYVAEDLKKLNHPEASQFQEYLENPFMTMDLLFARIYFDPSLQKYKDEWDNQFIGYGLLEVVTNSIDPQTKNIECQAVVFALSRFGLAQMPVKFDVKVTSNGEHLMQIYGLN
jgi:hypothetical protein